MKDKTYEDPARIATILGASGRLSFVLSEGYGLTAAAVTALRLDGDNFKIDVWSGERMIRFKAKGTERVLASKAEGGMAMTFDPALAQAIYALVDEYSG